MCIGIYSGNSGGMISEESRGEKNKQIRHITGMEALDVILRKTRLHWLGHVHRMDDSRIP